jgi:hypothetical protein
MGNGTPTNYPFSSPHYLCLLLHENSFPASIAVAKATLDSRQILKPGLVKGASLGAYSYSRTLRELPCALCLLLYL